VPAWAAAKMTSYVPERRKETEAGPA